MAVKTIDPQRVVSDILEAGNKLVVSISGGGSALIELSRNSSKIAPFARSVLISASTTYGPFNKDCDYKLTALAADVEYEETDDVIDLLNAANLSIDPTGLPADVVNQQVLNNIVYNTVIDVSSSRDLANTDDGKTLRCTTALTLTVPEGLRASFGCVVRPPDSGNVTIARSGSVTLDGSGTSQTRSLASNKLFCIQWLTTNTFTVTGS